MSTALEGIRVADFSHVIAGPFCTMILADMGAEVIKIEPPEGDASRSWQPPDLAGESTAFLSYNRNKQGVVLNLTSEEGRRVARDIVACADILVENFATGVMQRMGFDYPAMEKINPRLIYCSISGYGRTGAFAGRASFDQIVQAESGFMSLNGFPDREPLRTPLPVIDFTTGMFAAHAILAALYARERSGRGQYVEVAMFDNAFSLTAYFTMNYLITGEIPPRFANRSLIAAPIDMYDAADGKFYMTVASERVWRKLLKTLENPPELLVGDYANSSLRLQNQARLKEILQRFFSRASVAEWMQRLHAAGVPAGRIRNLAEAVNSPEAKERRVLGTAPHSKAGEVPNMRLPFVLAGTPLIAPRGAPVLGEHTRAVLSRLLGYGPERIAELVRTGVITP